MDVMSVEHLPVKTEEQPLGVPPSEILDGVLQDLGHERISYGHWTHSAARYYYLYANNPYWVNANTLAGRALGL